MKAVNRLDYGIELRRKLQFDLITVTEYLNLEEKADALYSQPFKPEMITELFEGWGQSTILRHYKNGKFEIICDGERIAYYTPSITVNKQPQTLNDFISDCQRAGIELTFKKEIEDKLC